MGKERKKERKVKKEHNDNYHLTREKKKTVTRGKQQDPKLNTSQRGNKRRRNSRFNCKNYSNEKEKKRKSLYLSRLFRWSAVSSPFNRRYQPKYFKSRA